VRDEALPAPLAELVARVAPLGFVLVVRWVENEFRLPYFKAVLSETGERGWSVHVGFGCHPVASIAATRAVCEAFQNRLSVIHGGRDDLLALQQGVSQISEQRRTQMIDAFSRRSADAESAVNWSEVDDRSAEVASLEDAYTLAHAGLATVGAGAPLRVAFTAPDAPLQVVKVVVPRLEFVSSRNHGRMGVRMRRALKARKT
jgi:ribosomal protein S12 methylthiotransferase accessory factor